MIPQHSYCYVTYHDRLPTPYYLAAQYRCPWSCFFFPSLVGAKAQLREAADELPQRLRSHAGLKGIVVVEPREARSQAAQRDPRVGIDASA